MSNNFTIQITDAAATHLKKQPLIKKNAQAGFRLTIKDAGCSGFKYVPDIVAQPQPDDKQLVVNDINVFIDNRHLAALHGIIVDFVKKNLGMGQLVFLNPNAKNACGCGESFTL